MNSDDSKSVIIEISGRMFRAESVEDEPRVRDVQLGEWLGFERPRKVREIIKRAIKCGDLPGILWRPTVGRQKLRSGGVVEKKVDEYWLTESEALFIAAKSDTPKANQILKNMIEVYRTVRKRLVDLSSPPPSQALPNDTVEAANRRAWIAEQMTKRLEQTIADIQAAREATEQMGQRHGVTAQLRNDPWNAKEVSRYFGRISRIQGCTIQAVHGYIRRVYGTPSYKNIILGGLPDLFKRLRRLEDCEELIPKSAIANNRRKAAEEQKQTLLFAN